MAAQPGHRGLQGLRLLLHLSHADFFGRPLSFVVVPSGECRSSDELGVHTASPGGQGCQRMLGHTIGWIWARARIFPISG